MIYRNKESGYETWERFMTNTEDNVLTIEHLSYISNNTYYSVIHPCPKCLSPIIIPINITYKETEKIIELSILCGVCLSHDVYTFYNFHELQNELKELKTIEI